jgi:hypothetical protein
MTDQTYLLKRIGNVFAGGKSSTVGGVKVGDAFGPGDCIRIVAGVAYITASGDALLTGVAASKAGHADDADFDVGDIIEYYPIGQKTKVHMKLAPIGVRGHQECGLSAKTGATETGLSTTTQYYFKINIDGGGVTEYDITTASDSTYAAVIILMNAEITGAEFAIVGGDLRCSSITYGDDSVIALTAGSTGTDLFATLTNFSSFDTAVDGDDYAVKEGEIASLSAIDGQVKLFEYANSAVATDTLLLKVGRFVQADISHDTDMHIVTVNLGG